MKINVSSVMRLIHRYLGFFLVGIMTMYALSGMVLIFRDTDFLKYNEPVKKQLQPNIGENELEKHLRLRRLKVEKTEDDLVYFEGGTYNKTTGKAEYVVKKLPFLLEKMTKMHKAKSTDSLFFLNIFFAISLLFFAVSTFWMFKPKNPVFLRGMWFTLGGMILTVILLIV